MIPRVGVDQSVVLKVLSILRESGATLRIEPRPETIRRMLTDSARPIPKLDPSEVGAGFVSTETTLEYLREFDGLAFARLFAEGGALDEGSRFRLSQMRLADSSRLGFLEEVARRSAINYAVDFRTGEIHASMRDPGFKKGESGFTKTPSRYSWPPPL
jgi:hypothetical protein